MRFVPITVVHLFAALTVSLVGTACEEGGSFVVDRPDDTRPVGQACVLDAECESGRCIGGICDDGGCTLDDDCREGEICVFGACEDADNYACRPGQRPLINIQPLSVEFGEVSLGSTAESVITIENQGDCLLTLQGVGLSSLTTEGFSCEPCDVTQFPQRVPPSRALDVTVRYSPTGPGEAEGQVLIRSDDLTSGDEGLVGIDLHAAYSGVPRLVLEPAQINFGYVPFQAGGVAGERTEHVRVMNQGSGNAALTTQFIFVQPGTDFSLPPEFAGISPASPRILPPYNPNDASTWIDVPVTFRPTRNANQSTTLTVNAHAGDPAAAVNIPAQLTASSLGPPQINVSATELTYRQDDGQAYPVGLVAFRQVTISNSGQSDLNVDMALSDPSGDFSLSPSFVPPIAPGGAVIVSVFYNPSQPSDPASPHAPNQSVNAFFNITSNDTDPGSDVLKTVALRGFARGGLFDDVLKLEMTFENADNSWAGNDYRNVDMEVISPSGFSCTKPIPQFQSDGQGGFVVVGNPEDPCLTWNSFQREGTVDWIALGQYEEPERVLLFGLGQELANGQDFTVRLHYVEDCANIPTGLLADLLGIGASALLGVLGGSIGVPISVPPDQISDLIAENCWDRASSLATVHISLNGQEVASPQIRLRQKGDFVDVIRLHRENGQFTILP